MEHDGLSASEENISALNEFMFDFDYVFYDSSKKDDFQKRFIRNFYMREIAFETIARFKLELMNVFQVELPKFNRLFDLFEDDEWKIKDNVDYITEFQGVTNNREQWDNDRTNDRTDNLSARRNLTRSEKYDNATNHSIDESSNENNEQKNAFSDTPQGSLSNVENNTYLTDYRNIKDDNNATHTLTENEKINHAGNISDSETNTDERKIKDAEKENRAGILEGVESWNRHIHGKYGVSTNSKQYKEYVELVQSPESLFFKLCDKKLFLMVWDL